MELSAISWKLGMSREPDKRSRDELIADSS
jgi:hypothetical protein